MCERKKIVGKDLDVWKKSMDLADHVYEAAVLFPKDELFGLSSQIKRCAVSVPSNIAEGSARHTTKEFIRFLSISKDSLAEFETQLLFAQRRNFISPPKAEMLLQNVHHIENMLGRLQSALRKKL